MKRKKAERVLEQVAAQNGVSVGEVRAAISEAIEAAMKNPEPEVREKWARICKNGKPPSPEETITHFTERVEKQLAAEDG